MGKLSRISGSGSLVEGGEDIASDLIWWDGKIAVDSKREPRETGEGKRGKKYTDLETREGEMERGGERKTVRT